MRYGYDRVVRGLGPVAQERVRRISWDRIDDRPATGNGVGEDWEGGPASRVVVDGGTA